MPDVIVMRHDRIYTLKRYPARAPNPGKFRWAVYRDGTMVGAARTKADFEQRLRQGWYDEDDAPRPAAGPIQGHEEK